MPPAHHCVVALRRDNTPTVKPLSDYAYSLTVASRLLLSAAGDTILRVGSFPIRAPHARNWIGWPLRRRPRPARYCGILNALAARAVAGVVLLAMHVPS